MESIERKFTKYVLNDYVAEYTERLNILHLLPLSYCKEYFDVCFLFKVVNEFYNVNFSHFIKFHDTANPRTRSQHQSRKLMVNFNRTLTADKFFTTNVVKIWNTLPTLMRLNNNINSFKVCLKEYYFNRLGTWDVNDACSWVTCCCCAQCRQ